MRHFTTFFFAFLLLCCAFDATAEKVYGIERNENMSTQLSVTLIDSLTTPGLCHGSPNLGTIYFIVDAGGLPFTVTNNWSVQSDTVFLDSLAAGDYSTFIQTSAGDTLTFFYSIADYPKPSVTIDYANSSLVDCGFPNNGNVTANITGGTPPYSIDPFSQFNLSGNTVTGSNLLYGNQPFSIEITDSNNCSAGIGFGLEESYFYISDAIGPYCAGVNGTEVTLWCSDDEFAHAFWVTGVTDFIIDGSLITLSNLAPGNYSITVYDNVGCPWPIGFTVGQSNLQLNTTVNPTSCIGCTNGEIMLSASGYSSYYDVEITPNYPITGDTISNLPAGIYDVCITDSLNCQLCVSDTILEDPTFVSSLSINNLNVYPNPVSQLGTILGQSPLNNVELRFFTESGKEIKIEYWSDDNNLIFDSSKLLNGIYFVQVLRQNKLNGTFKFIVKQ